MADFKKQRTTAKVKFTKDWKRFKKGAEAYMNVKVAEKVKAAKAGTYELVDFKKLEKQITKDQNSKKK